MDAEALRAHPHAAPFDWVAGRRANVVATWEPGRPDEISGRSLILNGHIDVVSPEPWASGARTTPSAPTVDGEWMYRPGRRRHEVRSGRDRGRGARVSDRWDSTPQAPVTIESVVEEECSGNGTLQTLLAGYTADAADHRRAVRRRDHHVAGRGALVQRADQGVPGHAAEGRNATNAIEESLAVIGALRGLEAELNAAPPAALRPVRPSDQPQRRHDPRRRLALDRAGRVRHRLPHRAVSGHDVAGAPRADRSGGRRGGRRPTGAFPAARCIYNGFASRGLRARRTTTTLVDDAAASFARQAGAPPALVATTGTTDARVFGHVGGIPAVCFGPYAEAAHGVGERVYLPTVIQTAQVHGLVHPGLVRAVMTGLAGRPRRR